MSALDLSDFISMRADELNLSVTSISKVAGISRCTWYRLINADVQQANVETLMRVAYALQINVIELFYFYSKRQSLPRRNLINTKHTNNHDYFILIRDITNPLNAIVKQGELFEKKWKIINLGNTFWENLRFTCIDHELDIRVSSGEKASALKAKKNSIKIPRTAPGEHVILSIQFYAPKKSGTVISFWKMVNEQGEKYFPHTVGLSCQVIVVENVVYQ